MSSEWPGILDTNALNPGLVDSINRLADASREGDWAAVLDHLDSDPHANANQWRISGRSWFTPLHQAAWHGASIDVVEGLVHRGAWRSLRNADGDRPIDIARRRGHDHLLAVLAVREPGEKERRKFAAWDRHLADLVADRTRRLGPVRFRPVSTEVIAFDELDHLWFGYPGMYGGFDLSIHRGRLFVESWSRMVSGSGQAHVITESGCVLVEEGFV